VTLAPAPRHPWRFRLFYAAVLIAALALMALAATQAAAPPWAALVVVGALMVFSEAGPMALPVGGYATASAVFDLPGIVILGPFWTAVLDVACTGIVQGGVLRKPRIKVLFNMACFALTDLAAGVAYSAAGGRFGQLRLERDLGPLLACGITYFVVNSGIVSTIIGLTSGPSPWRVWQRNFQAGLLHHLSFIALGTLVAVAYFGIGAWGVVLYAIPFLVARQAFRLYVEIRSDLKDFVRALTEVLDEIDPYTRHHSQRVAEYAVRIARDLRLPEHRVEEIEYAALMHDLGKIAPDHQRILQKAGGLTQEELRTLRAHPASGAQIVARVRALRAPALIVRCHHEQPDGRGYPFGLHAADVPLGARILKVADAFDAMTSDRPYRDALSVDAALREIERGAGTQFDAQVVESLSRMLRSNRFPLVPSPSREDLELLKLRPVPAHS
jgi:hypothetical protein